MSTYDEVSAAPETAAVVAVPVLDGLAAWFGRFIRTVSDADHDLLALWTVHTHVSEECYTSPRLQLDSPMPGSGKTTVLEHLSRLCRSAVSMASISSPALLVRLLAGGPRTILIDEADRSLDPERPGVGDLLAVLNSGYKRGATRPVLVPVKGGGWDAEEMSTFAPVAMAGNNPRLPDDTASRIIRVLLLPDLDGLAEESDWELIEAEAAELAAAAAAWADEIRDPIRTCRPALPGGITGRFREKWQPLARVAAMSGGRWPAAVAAMALQDREQHDMDKEDGLIRERPSIALLRCLHDVWPAGATFVPSADLAASLAGRFPQQWGSAGTFGKDLTSIRMGRMLATGFKLNSTRPGNTGQRGYTRASLDPIWRRLGIDQVVADDPVNVANVVNVVAESPSSPTQPRLPEPPRHLPPAREWLCERCFEPVPEHGVLCDACMAELTADEVA